MLDRRMRGYDDVLFGGLPAALVGIGAGEVALGYLRVLERGDDDDLPDALAEVCDQTFAIAAMARGPGQSERAERAERIASLAHHLMMHETLVLGAPRRSALHHDRALEIARELGLVESPSFAGFDA